MKVNDVSFISWRVESKTACARWCYLLEQRRYGGIICFSVLYISTFHLINLTKAFDVDIAFLLSCIAVQGKISEAEQLFRRSLATLEKNDSPDHLLVEGLLPLANTLREQVWIDVGIDNLVLVILNNVSHILRMKALLR